MRKPSPISISSPRLIGTSRPLGERREHQHHRGRVVVDGHAVLGARQLGAGSGRGGCGATRARRRRGRTRGSSSRSQRARRARSQPAGSGARPRFVCTMTPVAFSAGRRLGGRSRCRAARASSSSAPSATPAPAGVGERRADRLDGGRAPVALGERDGSLVPEQGVDRRQASQRMIGHGAILCPHVPRQRRPTLYAMQSFGRRQRPRRLPPVRPLATIAVVVASALLATAAFVTHRLWPLTDRAAGAIDAPALTAPAGAGAGGPGTPAAGAARRRGPGRAPVPGRRPRRDRRRPDDGSRALPEGRPPPASRSRASPSS